MARGRMLNKRISRDKAVGELARRVGGTGALFYTWLIAHLDREGRMDGEPVILRGTVVPWIDDCTPELIEKTLGAASDLGLVEWYEVDGQKYVSYPKFHHNQVGLRVEREPESDIPAPPPRQTAGALPEECRQPSGNYPAVSGKMAPEGKGREGKEREGNVNASALARAADVISLATSLKLGWVLPHGGPAEAELERVCPMTLEEFDAAVAETKAKAARPGFGYFASVVTTKRQSRAPPRRRSNTEIAAQVNRELAEEYAARADK